jgi:hypothetical protein
MRTILALIAAAISLITTTASAKDVTTADLKKLSMSRIEALAKVDTTALRGICAKDYQFINSVGSRMSLAELTKSVIGQKKQMKSYVILTFQPFIAEDESMAFAVSEIEEEILQDKAVVKNSLILTEIYRKENGSWKVQLTQTSQKICNYP